MTERPALNAGQIHSFLRSVFQNNIHTKRIDSLANATLGTLNSSSLKVSAIGEGLARARGLDPKHAVKQVDRLLSNPGIESWSYFEYWIPKVVAARKEILVAMDWTEFDKDGHSTIALHLVTRHGRATPLLWKTVPKGKLKDNRNEFEDEMLLRLKEVLSSEVKVTILADRGFGDRKLLEFLCEKLGFEYVIRIRGNITVTSAIGESRRASEWIGRQGRPRTLRNATITAAAYPVPTVVCVHAQKMKEPWCLVCSDLAVKARVVIDYYAKRWSIEPSFRDTKDLRFGMGLKQTKIKHVDRRDRLLLINAFVIFLLTLLGAAGESLGMDRRLKANTVKRRTHSLFRQGLMYFNLMQNMAEHRLHGLMERFGKILLEQRTSREVFGFV